MRALVQRVSEASVSVGGQEVAAIGTGLLVFLGIRASDTDETARLLARKVCQLRVFPDQDGRMSLSSSDVAGELLIVSQFTLYGDIEKGNRPSYSKAARAEIAENIYNQFVRFCALTGLPTKTGVFQANMDVRLTNRGPVTLLCQIEAEN